MTKINIKRFLSVIMALIMSMSLNVTVAFATEEPDESQIVEVGGKNYYLSSGEDASADNYDVWTSKTIQETGVENEFEITLQVGSTLKAISKDVAVVLVVDTSASMMADEDGKLWLDGTTVLDIPADKKTQIEYAREAMLEFSRNIVEDAGDSKRMLSIVEFGNNAYTVLPWTNANLDGSLNSRVPEAIQDVDVNFVYDNKSYWRPDDAQKQFGRIDYWDDEAGCTLSGCKNTEPNHIHGCMYGEDGTYPFYSIFTKKFTYRCMNPDPNHTHDIYDGDRYYAMEERDLQKYKGCATNMEGGLLLARNLVSTGLAEGGAIAGIDDVYVIMLSDGVPTFYVNETSATEVNFVLGQAGGISHSKTVDWEDIVSNGTDGDIAIAEDIKDIAELYAILYASGLNQKLGYTNKGVPKDDAQHELKEVTGVDWITLKNEDGRVNYVGVDEAFMSVGSSDLSTAFGDIGERIEMLSKAWTVTDALSDEVDFDSFTLNGQFASYDKNDHEIIWNVGDMEPENEDATGTVEDPYVYTLKYKIRLNPDEEGVYEASKDNVGVNTNKNAQLYYIQTDGEENLKELSYEELKARSKEVSFAHPSVKAFYADYEFTKLLANDDSVLANIGFTLYKNGEVWGEEVFSDENGKVRFERISAGEYKLCETTVPDRVLYMTPIEFVVSYGKISTVAGSEMPEVIYNSSEQRIITFYKTAKVVENSEESPRPLEGIEFEIYYLCSVEEYNQKLQTGEITESNAIEKLEREYVATVATDKGGKAMYNLTENQQPDGIYLIVELEHDAIEKPVDPFLVAVPGTKKETGEPVYVVDITPKNVPVKPDIKKDVMKPSYDMDENVTWIIQGDIPKDMAKALSYVITDQLDERLTYVGNVVVKAEKTDAAKVKPAAETGLLVGTDYTLSVKDNSIKIELTKEGRAKVAEQVGEAYEEYELRVYFDTYIDADAAMGEVIPNSATLEYINSANFKWVVLPENTPDVYTTGIHVHKYDAKDASKALAGAVFKLAEVVDKDTAGAVPLVIKNAEGKVESVYAVYKEFYIDAACTTKANTVTTNAEGNALLYGLEAGNYYLVEIKAPAGYNLLSYPVQVTLDQTSHHTGDIEATQEIEEIDRTVYVANSNTFVLPETGGIGTTIFTLAGSLMMGGAGVMLVNKKKDEE